MTDIVERLRASSATWLEQGGSSPNLHEDAADEIERLRKMLRKAEDIARKGCLVPPDGGSPTPDETLMCEAIADRIRALWSAQ